MIASRRRIRLFVYGSLMRGQEAHHLLDEMRGARRIGRASIRARLFDLRRYPAAVHADVGRVHGEIWELDSRPGALARLDRYEAFDRQRANKSLFVRQHAAVRLPDGTVVRAWAYFLRRLPMTAAVIENGDWRAHQRLMRHQEIDLVRNRRRVARLVPEAPAENALEVFGDLYRTLDDRTADALSNAVSALRKRRTGRVSELRNPWPAG